LQDWRPGIVWQNPHLSTSLGETVTKTLSPINAANLKEAHKLVESGRSMGKVTLAGF
jgi:hypothetical protein